MLFDVGQMVVYGIHGVCRILDTQVRRVDKKNVEYFVLEPTQQPGTLYYIPTQNPVALSKIRPLITKKQFEAIISNSDSLQDPWIADENQRRQKYREMITSADSSQLISMVRALYIHKNAQLSEGKKFHICDENFLRDSERLLTCELSIVLNMNQQDVPEYMKNLFGDF